MSVLEDVLEEEYARSSRLLGLMEQEIGLLPKGSIRTRNIKGHEYCYLNYRVGDKVKSDYVPAADVDELRAKIERRRALAAAIRESRSNLRSKSYEHWEGCQMLTEQQRFSSKTI